MPRPLLFLHWLRVVFCLIAALVPLGVGVLDVGPDVIMGFEPPMLPYRLGLLSVMEAIMTHSPLPLGVTSYLIAVSPLLALALWNALILLRPWFNGNVHVFDNGLEWFGALMLAGFSIFCGGVGAGLMLWPSTRWDSVWLGPIGLLIGLLVIQYGGSGLAWVNTDSRRVTVFGILVPFRSWRFNQIQGARLLQTKFRSEGGANLGSHWEATLLVGSKKKEVAIGKAGEQIEAQATLGTLRRLIGV